MSTEIQTVRGIQTTNFIQAMNANKEVTTTNACTCRSCHQACMQIKGLAPGMYANQENYPRHQQISVGHLVQQQTQLAKEHSVYI